MRSAVGLLLVLASTSAGAQPKLPEPAVKAMQAHQDCVMSRSMKYVKTPEPAGGVVEAAVVFCLRQESEMRRELRNVYRSPAELEEEVASLVLDARRAALMEVFLTRYPDRR